MEQGTTVATAAFVGQAFLAIGNGASPETFERYCEVTDISGIGVKNDTVEATTFCSGGSKQYIPGLGDGQEVTITANYALNNAIQEGMIDDVDGKVTRNFELQFGDDSPITRVFKMSLAMLSWEIDPSVSKQNEIKFTGKITGNIDRTETT